MDLRSGRLECKLDLNVVVDILNSYKRKNKLDSYKLGCIHRFFHVVVFGRSCWIFDKKFKLAAAENWLVMQISIVIILCKILWAAFHTQHSSLTQCCHTGSDLPRGLNLLGIRVSSSPCAPSPSRLSPSVSPHLPWSPIAIYSHH